MVQVTFHTVMALLRSRQQGEHDTVGYRNIRTAKSESPTKRSIRSNWELILTLMHSANVLFTLTFPLRNAKHYSHLCQSYYQQKV